MEFLLGSVFTIVLFSIVRFVVLKLNLKDRYSISPIIYTQSRIHSLVGKRVAELIYPKDLPKTQSRELLSKSEIKVIFSDKHAYWIRDHKLYQADIINGQIDNSTKKIVDTMAMDKVELDKMFFIVQKLTEGNNNDGRNPGVKDL